MKYTVEYLEDIKKVLGNIPSVEELRGKSVLVTGATGLIGSAVADLLLSLNEEENYGMNILLAGRDESRMAERFAGRSDIVSSGGESQKTEGEKGYSFVKYDAARGVSSGSDTDGIKADYIIHGASNADPKRIMAEPVETMLANIQGLAGLMDSVDKTALKRVLYISSSEVYGVNETFEPYTEEQLGYVDILNPRSCYPSSKRATETMCVAYAEEYGVDVVMVRPGHILAPRRR